MSQNNNLKNSEVAEILGAFLGDGWIEKSKKALYICGDQKLDRKYYDEHILKLFKRNIGDIKTKNFSYWKVYGIVTYKKETIENAIALGFQIGHKSTIAEIPSWIMKSTNKEIIKSVLRGIFDTDGSFWCERSRAKTSCEWKRTHNYHPEMRITSCSKKLLEQYKQLLDRIGIESKIVQKAKKGFRHGRNINDSFALNVRKISEIEKWFSIINSNNPRHLNRFNTWKEKGYL